MLTNFKTVKQSIRRLKEARGQLLESKDGLDRVSEDQERSLDACDREHRQAGT